MKTCLVIGYMHNNLGDDLFFDILFKRYPNVKFYMYPPAALLKNYKKLYKKYHNVVFYNHERYFLREKRALKGDISQMNLFPMILERAKKVDFYINIGGSIFIQNDHWKEDDRFKIMEIIGNKPSFILGCNFGPGNKEYYEYYSNWFKKFDDICFREKKSYDEFKHLPNTRLADDIVLIDSDASSEMEKNPKQVGISLVKVENYKDLKKYAKDYYDFITKTTKFFIKRDYIVNFYSFCENDGDLEAIEKVMSEIEDTENINIIRYKDNMSKFLKSWSSCGLIIASRFHASVLALKYQQNLVPLIYSDKTKNYLKDVNKKIVTYDIKDIKNYSVEKMKYSRVINHYDSERQFEKLDNYIYGKKVTHEERDVVDNWDNYITE